MQDFLGIYSSSRIKRFGALIVLFISLGFFSVQTVSAKIVFGPIADASSESNRADRNNAIINIIDLIGDLREKTGLWSINLSSGGELLYNRNELPKGGSTKMRRLIAGAIDDRRNTFHIRDRSGRDRVHFAVTDAGTVDINSKNVVYEVDFDFDDFASSARFSSERVFGAFSLGIILFHEIDHKVSYDPFDPIPSTGFRPDESRPNLRGVIENTNIVRRELGLILRDARTYHGRRHINKVNARQNLFQILFRKSSGKRAFLRWKIR